MKNSIDRVISKMPQKTYNFKNQKVDLSLIQDILKDIESGLATGERMIEYVDNIEMKNDELLDIQDKYNSLVNDLNSDIDGYNTTRNIVVVDYNRASSKYEEIVNKSSDLGIDVPTEIEIAYKELDELYNYQENAFPEKETKKRKEIQYENLN
jgi:hypothetical protein